MTHYNGSPDGCSATCNGPHIDDAPAGIGDCCEVCGGNINACYPVCTDRSSRSEPYDGRTAQDEANSYYSED